MTTQLRNATGNSVTPPWLKGQPAALIRSLRQQCEGDWLRVTEDGDGGFTVHNSRAAADRHRKPGTATAAQTLPTQTVRRSPSPLKRARRTASAAIPATRTRAAAATQSMAPPPSAEPAATLMPRPPLLPPEAPAAPRPAVPAVVFLSAPEAPAPPPARVDTPPAAPEPAQARTAPRRGPSVRLPQAPAVPDAVPGADWRDALAEELCIPAPGGVLGGVSVQELNPGERARLKRTETVLAGMGASPQWEDMAMTPELLGGFRDLVREGIPQSMDVAVLDEVAALGLDLEVLAAAVRFPEAVEVRPESADKGWPILGLRRGDMLAIVGLRNPTRPVVLAAYTRSRLEHYTPRKRRTGGHTTHDGPPRTGLELMHRLRDLGATVEDQPHAATVAVSYAGQPLGRVSMAGASRQTVLDDWARLRRRVTAAAERQTVAAGA